MKVHCSNAFKTISKCVILKGLLQDYSEMSNLAEYILGHESHLYIENIPEEDLQDLSASLLSRHSMECLRVVLAQGSGSDWACNQH